MAAMAIPEVLYQGWFWLAILAGLFVALHFVRKRYPPPFPRVRRFFARHKKGVDKTNDVLVTACVVMSGVVLLSSPLRMMSEASSQPPEIRTLSRQFAWTHALMTLIYWSGIGGFLVGLLSPFQRNLTPRKRIILLVFCSLPLSFGVMAAVAESGMTPWSMIQLGVMASVPAWIVNGPGVLTGRPLSHLVWRLMCRLHLASGDLSD